MDEVCAEVDVLHVFNFVQRRPHQQRRAEISDVERWFLLFDKRPDRLLSNLFTNAIVDKWVLELDRIFSVELELPISASTATLMHLLGAYW